MVRTVKYFPIFAAMDGQGVIVSGAGNAAVAKLRLLLKTPAVIRVYGDRPTREIVNWHESGLVELVDRPLQPEDVLDCLLFYAANEDDDENDRVLELADRHGVLTNTVDDPSRSRFITPAIVDRSPVTVAIGTEGAAPVLARRIKAMLEEMLPVAIGVAARTCNDFRHRVAAIGNTGTRRRFWERIFPSDDPFANARESLPAFRQSLDRTLREVATSDRHKGIVMIVGSGPGDPDLLTLRARREIDRADIVLHDRLVSPEIIELARREAKILDVGKHAYGSGWKQDDINTLMIEYARSGNRVVRLKSGDPVLFGRLDEEIGALEASGIDYEVVPGITSASSAAASIGRSLTRRQRNSSLRFVTGHDMNGYTELDWRNLSRPGTVTVIYMGRKSAGFIRGRLLMHGADAGTPATIVASSSRPDQIIIPTTLGELPDETEALGRNAPAIILLGLAAGDALAGDIVDLAMEQA